MCLFRVRDYLFIEYSLIYQKLSIGTTYSHSRIYGKWSSPSSPSTEIVFILQATDVISLKKKLCLALVRLYFSFSLVQQWVLCTSMWPCFNSVPIITVLLCRLYAVVSNSIWVCPKHHTGFTKTDMIWLLFL